MISIKGYGKISLYMSRDLGKLEICEITASWMSRNKSMVRSLLLVIQERADAGDIAALSWWSSTLQMFASEISKYLQTKSCADEVNNQKPMKGGCEHA